MHHSKPTTSSCGRCMHSQHNPCPTELTSCGKGSMTREGSAWWGDITQKRNKVKEVNKGGHSHAPLQTHNVLMRPAHAQPAQPLPNRTHPLRRRKHDKGGTRVGGRHNSEEKKRCRKCTRGGIPMHHSKPTTSSCGRCTHSQHNPCPTKLTTCGEGGTTREGSTWWGDITQMRNKV